MHGVRRNTEKPARIISIATEIRIRLPPSKILMSSLRHHVATLGCSCSTVHTKIDSSTTPKFTYQAADRVTKDYFFTFMNYSTVSIRNHRGLIKKLGNLKHSELVMDCRNYLSLYVVHIIK